MEPEWSIDDLDLALRLADLAAVTARASIGEDLDPQIKRDGSPVTQVDIGVERALLRVLAEERPHDAALSEESGPSGTSHRRWLLDPIDGTEELLRGASSWGTHIALECRGEIVLGVMTRPMLKRRWWAAEGFGAHRGDEGGPRSGTRLQVSGTNELARARVSVWSEGPHPVTDHLAPLTQLTEPAYDDYIAMVEGRLDAIVFPRTGVAFAWDHAPAVILTSEAGGSFRDVDGGRSVHPGTGVFSNGSIDAELSREVDHLLSS